MAKALKTAGTILLVAGAIVFTAGAALIPAVAGGGLLGAAGTAVFGVTAGQMLTAGLVLSSLGSSFTKPKIVGLSESGGTQVDFKADVNAPVPLLLGRTGTSGNIVHVTTDGQAFKNAHLLYVTVLSHGPIEAYESFRAGDVTVTFAGEIGGGFAVSGVGPGGAADNRYNSKMILRTQLGLQQDPAPEFLTPWVPDRIPEWTPAHKLSGLAASWYGLEYDQNVYSTGTPKPQWVLKGAKAYDPRQDSTYPGGSGACRADDQATWVWSENPYVLALSWSLGWRSNGQRVLGVGAAANQIDIAAFVEGANVADANAWTCGGVVTSSDDKWEVLSAILQAGGGTPTRLGARISCVVNTPRVSLATVTGKDLAGDWNVAGTQPRRNRINRVIPRYRSEDHDWQVVPAGPVQVDDYITEDGGQRSREIAYPLCQDAAQAAQLAAYAIVDAREFGPITLPLFPKWMGLQPGDCLTVNEPELGLVDQKVLVLERSIDPASGVPTLTCRSETDAKHDFALGRTGTPPDTPGLEGVDSLFVPTPGDGSWAITANAIAGPGGVTPAIVVSGAVDAPASATIVDYRKTADAPGGAWSTDIFPTSAERLEVRGVAGGVEYEARVRYRNLQGVEDPAASLHLGEVTTAASVAGGIDTGEGGIISGPEIISDLTALILAGEALLARVREIFDGAWAEIEFSPQPIFDLAFSVLQNRAYLEALSFIEKQPVGSVVLQEQVRTDDLVQTTDLIGVKSDDGLTFILNSDTVVLDPLTGETAAERFTAITSSIAGNTASIATEASTRATADTAAAATVTSLTATVTSNHSSVTAAIATEQSVRASADSAAASTVTALGVTVAGNAATVTSGFSAQATINSAQSTTNSTLTASVADNAAAISTEASARASADSAAASVMALIGAKNGAGTAFDLALTTVRVGPTETLATRLSAIASSLGANEAAIASEASTRASADSATASSLSTLSATVGGHTSSITSLTSATADHTGKLAAWLEIVAAAGADPAYLKLSADSYGSEILLVAQAIGLLNVDDGEIVPALELVDGVARFSRPIDIIAGSIRVTLGPTFGVSNDLVLWMGPSSIAREDSSKANGLLWAATNGRSSFRGGMFPPEYSNGATTTLRAYNPEVVVGPFDTDGRQKTVTVSYSYYAQGSAPGNLTGTGSAGGFSVDAGDLKLYLSLDGTENPTPVSTNSTAITGAFTYAPYDPEIGSTFWEFHAEGSISYTDNTAGTQERTLRATAEVSGTGLFPHIVPPSGSTWNDVQRLGCSSVEPEDD